MTIACTSCHVSSISSQCVLVGHSLYPGNTVCKCTMHTTNILRMTSSLIQLPDPSHPHDGICAFIESYLQRNLSSFTAFSIHFQRSMSLPQVVSWLNWYDYDLSPTLSQTKPTLTTFTDFTIYDFNAFPFVYTVLAEPKITTCKRSLYLPT